MNIDRLIKMANEIGSFFAAEPDREEAARGVANHISRFWEPRMRREIITHLQRGGGGLDDIARRGIALVAAQASK